MEKIVVIILSSSVISAIVAAIINYIINKKSRCIEYDTKNIRDNNEKLEKIYHNIEKCIYKSTGVYDIKKYINDLKLCINFQGQFSNKEYNNDKYIWDCIISFQNISNEEEYVKQKSRLLECILVKINNNNNEIIGKMRNYHVGIIISLLCGIFSVIMTAQYKYLITDKNIFAQVIFSMCSLTLIVCLVILVVNTIRYWDEISKVRIKIIKCIGIIVFSILLFAGAFMYQFVLIAEAYNILFEDMEKVYFEEDSSEIYIFTDIKPFSYKSEYDIHMGSSGNKVKVLFVNKYTEVDGICILNNEQQKQKIYSLIEKNGLEYSFMVVPIELFMFGMLTLVIYIQDTSKKDSLKFILGKVNEKYSNM